MVKANMGYVVRYLSQKKSSCDLSKVIPLVTGGSQLCLRQWDPRTQASHSVHMVLGNRVGNELTFSEEAVSKDPANCLALTLTLETIVAVEIWNAIGRTESKLSGIISGPLIANYFNFSM